jgi:hypothetical protein
VCARDDRSAVEGIRGTALLSLCCLLLATTPGRAQSPPRDPITTAAPASLPGLVPLFEIDRTVRAAGFSPLEPPRREGTTYVLRAIDHREVLMRVVVDGRSGAIRATNRIVPVNPDGAVGVTPPLGGPGTYGSLPGPPPLERLPEPPPGLPPRDVAPDNATPANNAGRPIDSKADVTMPPPPLTARPSETPPPQAVLPLPRPRPTEVTTQKAKPQGKVPDARSRKPDTVPTAASDPRAAPRPAPAKPKKLPQIVTPD